jgi:superfamily II DNA or RNA helicase
LKQSIKKKNIDNIIIIGNCRIDPKIKNVILYNYDTLTNEYNELYNYISTLNFELKPRPYQIEAINNIIEYYKTNTEGTLYMPCGTGKTYISCWVSEIMKFKKICIFVPSICLVEQTKQMWKNIIKNKTFITHKNDIDTSLDEFIFIFTLRSFKNIPTNIIYDFIIYDELYDKNTKYDLKSKYKLYMSANMHEKINNTIIYEYDFLKAINDNVICDYIINIEMINSIDKYMEHFAKYILLNNLNHIIIVHKNSNEFNNILISLKLYEHMEKYKYYEVRTENASEITKKINFQTTIDDFSKNKYSVLNTVSIMKKGVDIKNVDCICLLNLSDTNLIQLLGRLFREYNSNKIGRMYIPILQTNIKQVQKIINTFRENDSRIGEDIHSNKNLVLNVNDISLFYTEWFISYKNNTLYNSEWCNIQRNNKNNLSKDQIQLLEKINNWHW